MNMRPKHYAWPDFYDRVIDLTEHTFSHRAIIRRLGATKAFIPRWLNVIRAVSSEGYGRLRFYGKVRERLLTDRGFRAYFEQESTELPQFYVDLIRRDLGPMWDALPAGAIHHDPYTFREPRTALPEVIVRASAAGSV
jgi:hypothetical protein